MMGLSSDPHIDSATFLMNNKLSWEQPILSSAKLLNCFQRLLNQSFDNYSYLLAFENATYLGVSLKVKLMAQFPPKIRLCRHRRERTPYKVLLS